jgi:glycosyltransferase involved in cell wall biosynthesis
MKLSIIVPTLQEEKMLEEVLLSHKKLTDFDYELIVSDGHSTDKTVEIANRHAHKVLVHDGKTRQTIGAGRNAGAKVASGDYFIFLDSDVFIPNINQFFKRAVALFEKDKNLLALTTELRTVPSYETTGDKISWKIVSTTHWLTNKIGRGIATSSGEFQMFRPEAFWEVGGYSETRVFGEDAQIFMRLSKRGKTKLDYKMYVEHTSRRAHNIGWGPLWYEWSINVISNIIRKKPVAKEWKVSR